VFRVVDLKMVSIASENLDESVATFRKNFGFPVMRTAASASGETRAVSLGIGGAEIEIATPAEEGSPLASFLAERGPGLYQLVLEVDDVAAAAADLGARGVEVSMKPGTHGRPAGFLSTTQTHGVRIMLVQR
jgi:methylmalonyl-CoA epimerase